MKKKILYTIAILVAISMTYLFVVFYLIGDGFRDYKNYCSQYIPKLESYYRKHHEYPKSLDVFEKSIFDFKYSNEECNYRPRKHDFAFNMSDGFMGIWGYESSTAKWWYD